MAAKDADQFINDKATPVLIVAIIAGVSFLLGSNLQKRSAEVSELPAVSSAAEVSESAVTSIEKSLNTTTTPEPTAAETTTSTSRANIAPAPQGKININTANQSQLETLTGIGPTKAQAIIDYRQANGPFLRIEDLDKVKGIGPATIEKIRSQITV